MSEWSEHMSPDGRPYYYNSISQESTWVRPAELAIMTPPPVRDGGRAGYSAGGYRGQQLGVYNSAPQTYPAGFAYDQAAGYGPPGGFPAAYAQSAGTLGPGPPIQKGKEAQGPPGSNLFVFHIPSQLTTRALYDMFSPYGQVVSTRIMVERDTGRSRGFGFVSFDSPEAADAAIRALDGFQVGNKRLKVSHKKEGMLEDGREMGRGSRGSRGRQTAIAGEVPGSGERGISPSMAAAAGLLPPGMPPMGHAGGLGGPGLMLPMGLPAGIGAQYAPEGMISSLHHSAAQ